MIVSGNVGIGTSNPNYKLEVAGTASATTMTLANALDIAYGGTGTSTAPSLNQILLGNASNGYSLVATSSLGFQPYGNYLTGNQSITISGVVSGSGTTSITTSFASTTPVGYGGTGNSAVTAGDILFGAGTSPLATSSLFTFSTISGLTVFATSTLATTTITALSVGTTTLPTNGVATFNGNVGIGTTSPKYLLQVGSSSVASGTVARFQNVNGTCDINPTTNTLACSSDQRLKKNISPMGNELANIMQLQSVWFNWNAEASGTSAHPGFLAQDVQKVMPEIVSTDPDSGLLSIGYSDLVPYLVAAIQQQQGEIATLQGGLTGNASTSNLTVLSPAVFSGDSVGEAEIPAGQTSVRVSFSQPYAYQPIVTITPIGLHSVVYGLDAIDSRGFTIEIASVQATDITFDWHSFASPAEQLTVSGLPSQPIQLVLGAQTAPPPLIASQAPAATVSTMTPEASSTTSTILGTSTAASLDAQASTTPAVGQSASSTPPDSAGMQPAATPNATASPTPALISTTPPPATATAAPTDPPAGSTSPAQ